jgi:hypothetical protein
MLMLPSAGLAFYRRQLSLAERYSQQNAEDA